MKDQDQDPNQFPSVRGLGDQFRQAALAEVDSSNWRVSRRRRLAALAGAFLAVTGTVSITPAGQAVADALGDFVGIGDEPSDPILFNGSRGEGTVIGVGEAPNGEPVELVAQPGPSGSTSACVYPSFPDTRVHAVGVSCNEVGEDGKLSVFPYTGPPELGADSGLLVTAKAFSEASAIEVVYLDPLGDEVVAPQVSGVIDETLQASVGAGSRFRYAVAFLPRSIVAPRVITGNPDEEYEAARRAAAAITVRALGADGEILASFNLGEDSPSWVPGTLLPGSRTAVYLGDPEGEEVTPVATEIGERPRSSDLSRDRRDRGPRGER